nr:hypothetical protein [Tanacetum cinerariifolium]
MGLMISSNPNGNTGFPIKCHDKFRILKSKIRQWNNNNKSMDRNRKTATIEELSSIDKKIDAGSATHSDIENRLKLLHELEDIDKFDLMDLIQKSRVKWDIEGDENSKFFHGLINQKRRNQMINGIMVLYPNLPHSHTLNTMDRDYLEIFVTLEEIKEAIWDCGTSKAPGPDGFSFDFVKKYWDIIQKDMFDFIDSFFVSSEMPHGANSPFFTLIPKVNNPTIITDFCPISLIGTHYKIIAKILANRLAKVIDKIVSKEQSAFIDGRQILDGPIILNHILDSLGFGYTWRSWIKSCLSSSRAFILVNGSPTSEFSINRGLRQGDPLSHFLFILVMEGLHNAFIEAVGNGLISGININNSTINISDLFFADDVIITTGWNARDLENIIRVLHVFYLASGLKINIHKYNIYGIGVNEEEVYNMASNAGCTAALNLLTLLFYKNGAGECSLLQMIFGSRSLKLFMAMKVVSIITDEASRVFGLTLLDLQTSFTRKSRTNLGARNLSSFRDMLNEIGQLNIEVSEDTCVWSLGPKGTFTVNDARNLIDQKSLPSLSSTTWKKSIPRKVNIFIWRFSLDRLPHRLNLSLRGMDILTISCSSCNANVESVIHIFFECTIASDMWKLVYRWCDIPFVQALSFEAFKDWFSSWHAPKDKKHKLYVISASSDQVMHFLVSTIVCATELYISFIYGENDPKDRLALWEILKVDNAFIGEAPWAMLGDFNITLYADECSNGPAMVTFPDTVGRKKRAFRFMNYLTDKKCFLKVVEDNWNVLFSGFDMYVLVKRLKLMKSHMRDLNMKNALDEEKVLRQKTKIKWLKEGDHNSAYFHQVVKRRKSRSRTGAVNDECGISFQCNDVAKQFVKHFQSFLGYETQVFPIEDAEGLFSKKISDADAVNMIKEVSEDEIKTALFDIDDDKASGPDGFTSKFFKSYLKVIKKDVIEAFKEFFKNGRMLGEVNTTLISLIPKSKAPIKVSDYRPVACCNVIYKCISKVMSNKIKVVLNGLIDKDQSAFVTRRQISDNVLLIQELMNGYNSKKKGRRCSFEVDIHKAYDTVNWEFLEFSLVMFSFHPKMIKWIMECLRTASYYVSVNGESHGFFKVKRGLRQGDPVSPYLFTIVMEVFSLMVNRQIEKEKGFKYHWGCKELRITHLLFADDLFLLCYGNLKSAFVLRRALDEFTLASGLYPSMEKSSVYFGNVPNSIKCKILMVMPFKKGSIPVRYLGVPLMARKLYIKSCEVRIDNVKKRVNDWRNKFLTFACRLQLIASILCSLQIIDLGVLFQFNLRRDAKAFDFLNDNGWKWPIEWNGRFSVVTNVPILFLNPDVEDNAFWIDNTGKEKDFCVKEVWKGVINNAPKVIWHKHERLKVMANLKSVSNVWGEVISSISNRPANNSISSVIQRLVFEAIVYYIWQERNARLFRNSIRIEEVLFNNIVKTVRFKLLSLQIRNSVNVRIAARIWNLKQCKGLEVRLDFV